MEMFGQKQIDSIVQRIKKQAYEGNGFRQGENHTRRRKDELTMLKGSAPESEETFMRIMNEVKYLRQEVEFLKKIMKADNSRKRKS